MIERNLLDYQKGLKEYSYVKEFLDRVLRRENIDMTLIRRFQPINPELYRLVSEWKFDPALSDKPVREERDAPTILAKTREKIDSNPTMQRIEGYLTEKISVVSHGKNMSEISSLIENHIGSELEEIYDKFTEFVIKTTALSIYHHLTRKCGVNAVAHWNAVGFMMYELAHHLNEFDKNLSAVIGYGHDIIEELLAKSIDGKFYGLERLDDFLNEVIAHDQIRQPILAVTNINNATINDLYRLIADEKRIFNGGEIIKRLDTHNPYHRSIKNALEQYRGMTGSVLREALKWHGYKRYCRSIGTWCKKNGIYTPFVDKDCDGFDNLHAIHSLGQPEQMKILNKTAYFSSVQYDMKLPEKHILNSLDDELLQYALQTATYMVIDHFLQPKAQVRHFESAFSMIKEMKPIFYTHEEKG